MTETNSQTVFARGNLAAYRAGKTKDMVFEDVIIARDTTFDISETPRASVMFKDRPGWVGVIVRARREPSILERLYSFLGL